MIAFPSDFLPVRRSGGPDGAMGSEGETHLPSPRRSPFQGVWSQRHSQACPHAHTHTHTHCEWCPLLLGVLASLMRCERGTEMEQVEEEKEVDQRNGAREEEM